MNNLIENQTEGPQRKRGIDYPGTGVAERRLEIVVIFTGISGTRAALHAAEAMAHGLNSKIRVLAPQAVPYAYSIEQPPIAVGFTERLLTDLVRKVPNGSAETVVEIFCCRERLRTLLEVLKPNSLVVIGGRNRIWPTKENLLARKLRSHGHEVVFAPIQ